MSVVCRYKGGSISKIKLVAIVSGEIIIGWNKRGGVGVSVL